MVGAFQPFRPVGAAHGVVTFHTRSWTGGDPEGYEVEFDTAPRTVRCSCPDAVCRRKNGMPIGDSGLCKHAALASKTLWPVIAKALGLSHAADRQLPPCECLPGQAASGKTGGREE